MKNQDVRRTAILGHLADHMLSHGLIASSLRPLAKAAQTSDRMLLYYFADKAEIIAASLDVIAAQLVDKMSAIAAPHPLPYPELLTHLCQELLKPEFWPYMRLWLEVASRAASGDPLYRHTGEDIGRYFLAWGAEQLDSKTPEDRAIDAARLLVGIEGSVLLTAIGLGDVARAAISNS